eukprot:1636746-Rhodomonas_salina.1
MGRAARVVKLLRMSSSGFEVQGLVGKGSNLSVDACDFGNGVLDLVFTIDGLGFIARAGYAHVHINAHCTRQALRAVRYRRRIRRYARNWLVQPYILTHEYADTLRIGRSNATFGSSCGPPASTRYASLVLSAYWCARSCP